MPLLPSPAVLRACDVLDYLARHAADAFSVSELARLMHMPRATCHSVLLALADRGLVVRRQADLRYAIGPGCIALGNAARGTGSVVARISPIAEKLARSTRSCVAISTRGRAEVRVADVFDHGPAFAMRTRVGETVPLVPPFGAVFVAWDDKRGVEHWLDRAVVELGVRERRRYRSALVATRRRGYSVTIANPTAPHLARLLHELVDDPHPHQRLRRRDELIRELVHTEFLPSEVETDAQLRVSQMSAPVFDHSGGVSAAIMVLGPHYDLSAAAIESLGTRLLGAAREATARAGGQTPGPSPRGA